MTLFPCASVMSWSPPVRYFPVRSPAWMTAAGLRYVQSIPPPSLRYTSRASRCSRASGLYAAGKAGSSTICTPDASARLPAPPTTSSLFTPALGSALRRVRAASTSEGTFPTEPGRGEMALTTASAPRATLATLSAFVASPWTIRTRVSEDFDFAGSRATATTEWPRATASFTMRRPMLPVAPNTTMFIGSLPVRDVGPARGGPPGEQCAAAPPVSRLVGEQRRRRGGAKLAPRLREPRRPAQPEPRRAIFERRAENSEAVLYAAAEPDRRRFREVPRRAGDLPDVEPEPDHLREDLVVEHEIVVVLFQRKRLQHPPGKRAVPGVVLGELVPEQGVLHRREDAVRGVLPDRHPAGDRAFAKDAGSEHDVEMAAGDHRRHRRQEPGRILVVRMQHDDDVGPAPERLRVAGLLVAPVSPVLPVLDDVHG